MLPAYDDTHWNQPLPVAVEVVDAWDRLHDMDRQYTENAEHNEDGRVVPIVDTIDLLSKQNGISLAGFSLLLLDLLMLLDFLLELSLLFLVDSFQELKELCHLLYIWLELDNPNIFV